MLHLSLIIPTTFLLLVFVLDSVEAWKLNANTLHKNIAATVVSLSTFGVLHPITSHALDLSQGQTLFQGSCEGCHAGGGNNRPFSSTKTLFKKDLDQNGYNSIESIRSIIDKGKGGMLAYGEFVSQKGNIIPARFTPEQMNNIAAYVLDRAEADWK